ncbi:AbrB/MazE/SpoVT family DNA-binding domain-containing protein [Candidatus Woesearchaeota archaeon]|nr:AbrB/MazE/SpoVT family DNA-binding domain-containing protein [Candidatus Woesearchaeota archaeon]
MKILKVKFRMPKKNSFIYKTNYDSNRWNMASVQVTRNYQITLGREIRRRIPLKVGDKLVAIVKGDNIIIRKSEKNPFERAFGIWKNKPSGIEYVDKIRASWRDFDDQKISTD